jgi:hypothetical protein
LNIACPDYFMYIACPERKLTAPWEDKRPDGSCEICV